MIIKTINIYFKNILLQKSNIKNAITLDDIKKMVGLDNIIRYPNEADLSEIDIVFAKLFEIEKIEKIVLLNDETKKIILYINLLKSLRRPHILKGSIKTKNYLYMYSYTSIISTRMYYIFMNLLDLYYRKEELVCFYLLRDMIEDIKYFLYFIVEDMNTDDHISLSKRLLCKKIDFDYEKDVAKKINLDKHKSNLAYLFKVNKNCDNYIHKNGLEKLDPKFINDKFKIEDVFYVLKSYFLLIFEFEEESLIADDYFDFLESDITPPEGCENWIAPIYADFISKEFTDTEINNMRESSNLTEF